MQLSLRQREHITVRRDGEEIEVYNWVNITRQTTVRGHNPCVERGDPTLGAGDSTMDPDAVTHWVADELEDEFYIDVTDHGIEVIDPTAEEVEVL